MTRVLPTAPSLERRAGRWLAVTSGLGALALTLDPIPSQQAASTLTPLLCLLCGDKAGVDVFLNLLLFAPLSFGLRLAGWSWRRAVIAVGLTSLTVELLQLTVVTGRDASLSDLVTNTTGAALAATIAPRWRAVLLAPRPRAARWFTLWAAVWLGTIVFTAWAQAPFVLDGPIASTWAGHFTTGARFTGRVLSAAVAGTPATRGGEAPDASALRRSLARGDATLDVAAISGPPTADLAFLYGLRVRGTVVLGIAQFGRDAVLLVPGRGQLLLLWPPTLQLRDGFPPDSGIPVQLHGAVRRGHLLLTSTWGGQRRAEALALGPTLGWSAVAPFKFVLGRQGQIVSLVWIAALTVPLGYWGAVFRWPAIALGAVASLLMAGLGVLPMLLAIPAPRWQEWVAGVAGVALGWALHLIAAYLQGRCASPSISESSSP